VLRIPQLFGSSRDSDPLSRWVPYAGFIDREVFRIKTGGVGMTLELDGLEYETRTHEQLERVSEKFVQASRSFGTGFHVYHHLLRREDAGIERSESYADEIVAKAVSKRADFLESRGLYSIRLYITVIYEPNPPKLFFQDKFSEERTQGSLNADLQANVATLKDAVYRFVSNLGGLLGISVLDKYGIFEHLTLLLNPEHTPPARLLETQPLDYLAANTEILKRRSYLEWGDYLARVLAMKAEPAGTFAHMFRKLLRIESNLTLTLEWAPELNVHMVNKLRNKRRRVWGQRSSAMEGLLADEGEERLADAASTNKAKSLNRAIDEITTGGNYFGHLSLMAVVFDRDEDRLRRGVAALNTVFTDHDAVLIEERRHRLRSFFATLPGNHALNIRYRYLLNTHYADLAPLYRPQPGSTVNEHLDSEYMTVLQSVEDTPVYLNLHVGQVAGTLVAGQTGSGKSVLMNRLITDSQKYAPYTFIADLGGSYREVTRKFGGSYVEVRLNERSFSANPFRQAYTPENVERIRQLIRVFLLNEGHTPTSEEDRIVGEEIHAVYGKPEAKRRLGRISLPKDLRARLHLWMDGGPYAQFFDNDCDDLQVNRFQTWDFSAIEDVPQLLGPLMFYLFAWTNNVVRDRALHDVPKGFWVDEGWRFGGTAMRDLIRDAAKTWRKHNGWVVFATQDEEDLHESGLLRVLSTCCHTKIFLPNPAADLNAYSAAFKLNQRELELLSEMQIGEMIVKTPAESRRCKLVISPGELEAYEGQFSAAATA
jgi:type IV secretion system protein TrbE